MILFKQELPQLGTDLVSGAYEADKSFKLTSIPEDDP